MRYNALRCNNSRDCASRTVAPRGRPRRLRSHAAAGRCAVAPLQSRALHRCSPERCTAAPLQQRYNYCCDSALLAAPLQQRIAAPLQQFIIVAPLQQRIAVATAHRCCNSTPERCTAATAHYCCAAARQAPRRRPRPREAQPLRRRPRGACGEQHTAPPTCATRLVGARAEG